MSQETKVIEKHDVVIRFSGDSGDGMQLTGQQFSDTAALFGNDVATFPDYPAEIRAPQGTVGGVSGFQVHIGEEHITTPGDYADVLVAMNPAALKANLRWAKKAGTIIVDIDAFTDKHIERAGYTANPLEDGSLADYNVVPVKVTELTIEALKETGLDQKSILRCKNMFALGMIYWMFEQSVEHTEAFFDIKFGKKPAIASANKMVLRAGYNYAANVHALATHFKVAPATIEKGKYRTITGNKATAWGLLAAAEKAGLPLFCGSYPITPATDILHELALRRDLGAKAHRRGRSAAVRPEGSEKAKHPAHALGLRLFCADGLFDRSAAHVAFADGGAAHGCLGYVDHLFGQSCVCRGGGACHPARAAAEKSPAGHRAGGRGYSLHPESRAPGDQPARFFGDHHGYAAVRPIWHALQAACQSAWRHCDRGFQHPARRT